MAGEEMAGEVNERGRGGRGVRCEVGERWEDKCARRVLGGGLCLEGCMETMPAGLYVEYMERGIKGCSGAF